MKQLHAALLKSDIAGAMKLWNDGINHSLSENYDVGLIMFNMYYYEQAKHIFSSILLETDEHYLLGVAKLWFNIGRFEESLLYSSRALELNGSGDITAMHASNLVRSGRVIEAEQLLLEIIDRNPAHSRCIRLLAHIERTTDRLLQARDRLEIFLKEYPSSDDWRLEYELGYILDRLGNYSSAMSIMQSAKSALRKTSQDLIPSWTARSEKQWQATQLLSTERLRKWSSRDGGEDIVIMAGFPRSGTTLLENILSTHKRCLATDETGVLNSQFIKPILYDAASALASIEELDDFYEEELEAGRAEYYRCTEAVINQQRNGRILLEKEPLMTAELALPLRLFPKCKILLPIRDPRDVVISFYFTIVPLAVNSVAAISLEESCKYYSEVMRHWLLLRQRIPQQRWMESRYEDLLTDTKIQTKKLAAFLEIPWNQGMLEHHKHKGSKAVSTPTYNDISKALYTRSKDRWRNYIEELEPHLHYLEPYIKAFGYEL